MPLSARYESPLLADFFYGTGEIAGTELIVLQNDYSVMKAGILLSGQKMPGGIR
ncbi:hypothetical protein BN1080_02039 [Planococcus massiliensis]|uniref:Uncharacterized protein n=1 Tax=Planococcus massiliensis TaxID=1499687 RepID=A0A098EP69_9BACL|nr:hypothetical protein BN1080_02039 [Planococcus massiliensis]